MDTFNLTQIENELRLKNSITDKLNYWKSIIDKYFNEPLTEQFGEYEFTLKQERAKKDQLIKLFGNDYRLISPVLIPEHIYNEHFENGLKPPEFTYWFLKYNAANYFEIIIKDKELPELLKSDVSLLTIKKELKRINDFEQKAEALYIENKFNFRNAYSYSEYAKEIEYMRIKQGFYKDHVLPDISGVGLPAQIYAEHIHLKNYLESNSYIIELETITRKYSDIEIYNLVKQYVFKTAKEIFNISEYHNINEPEKILFNELWKQNIVKEVRNNPDMQNNLFEVNKNISTLFHYSCKWIDHTLWELKKHESQNTNNKQIKGFQSKLSDEQIKSLYEQMQDYFNGRYDCFAAIFKPLSLVENFEKVIWLKKPTHLREFLYLFDLPPTQKIVKVLISNEKGKEIILPKINKTKLSSTYWELETIVKPILKKTDLKNTDK